MGEMIYQFWASYSWAVILIFLIFALDDLFVDLVAIFYSLKPHEMSEKEQTIMHHLPQKNIAILVANWKEYEVIERMVRGNVAHVDYINYTFFLGVYPNDTETWAAARRCEEEYSRVRVVVNSKNGPTNKGQMLNEIVQAIYRYEQQSKDQFDLFLMQDSEDLIHPLALKYINLAAERADFIQTPVFSLPLPGSEFVGATYLDEFAESHSKDMLVRKKLGAAVPSAGVGTAISKKLMSHLLATQEGRFLPDNTLTEDYQLGLKAHFAGFRNHFDVPFLRRKNGKKDFIATREYFPQNFSASVRQKSRWVLGISIQGHRDLGWQGSVVDRYFLWRDRRGLLNAIALASSIILLISYLAYFLTTSKFPEFTQSQVFLGITILNLGFMLWRVAHKIRCVTQVQDFKTALLVPLRWPLANVINFLASAKALKQHLHSQRTGEAPKWIKTDHILPTHFGLEAEVSEAKVQNTAATP